MSLNLTLLCLCETLRLIKHKLLMVYIVCILYILSHTQAPPQVAGNSPLPCMNTSRSEGHSSSIPTLDHHHPDTNSTNDGSSLTTVGVPTSTTQGSATTNSSIVTQKSDQLLACASPSHNQSDQSDDDDCHTDSCCKPAQVGYSPTSPIDLEVIIPPASGSVYMQIVHYNHFPSPPPIIS